MLIYDDLFGHHNKVEKAIELIRMYEPISNGYNTQPYYVCYSGGKDSDVIRILMELSGVPYELVHNHTTMDAPETVYYIRSIPNIKIEYPELSIHKLILKKKMPPTRIMRYCCSELKERGGSDRFCVSGVRWEESVKRAKNRDTVEIISSKLSNKVMLNNDNDEIRKQLEHCAMKSKFMLNPIIDWSIDDVWEFLRYYGCQSNPLYQCGYSRIGCVGCPMSYKRKLEFDRYPKFKENYIKTFDRLLMLPEYQGMERDDKFQSGEEIFEWWVNDKKVVKHKPLENQLVII